MSAILLEHDGPIAIVTLSNPGKLNAIDHTMWTQLRDCFIGLSAAPAIRCVLVRGADANFAAGADIAEFPAIRNTLEQGILYHTAAIGEALAAIGNCRHPTVAAIEGVCVGGGLEVACVCDLRIAAADARFGIPINRLGFALAPGELVGLLQLVGRPVALELLLEGRIFDAAEALQKGLITRIADDVPSAAMACAVRMARGAPLAAQMNKLLINRLTAGPLPLDAIEHAAAFALLASADYQEGVRAFLEKRPPVFSGT